MENRNNLRQVPASYNENVLVLLVQNTSVVFAYLELSNNSWTVVLQHGQPVLRLYVISDKDDISRVPVMEVTLPPLVSNWYFRGVTDGCYYEAELGWWNSNGLFISLVGSNRVHTPSIQRKSSHVREKLSTTLIRSVGVVGIEEDQNEGAWKDLPTSFTS